MKVTFMLLGILLGFATILALLRPEVRAWLKLYRRGVMATVAAVVLVPLAIWWTWPSGTSPTLSTPSGSETWSLQSPSIGTLWAIAKNYYLFFWMPALLLFFAGTFFPKAGGTMKNIAVAMLILMYAVVPMANLFWGKKSPPQQITRSEIPLASSPQSSWPKLVIPAGGRSEIIPVPPDMHIVMAGNNFTNHNVYQDGRECSFGQICPDGPLSGNYATNEARMTNIVAYAFEPKK